LKGEVCIHSHYMPPLYQWISGTVFIEFAVLKLSSLFQTGMRKASMLFYHFLLAEQ